MCSAHKDNPLRAKKCCSGSNCNSESVLGLTENEKQKMAEETKAKIFNLKVKISIAAVSIIAAVAICLLAVRKKQTRKVFIIILSFSIVDSYFYFFFHFFGQSDKSISMISPRIEPADWPKTSYEADGTRGWYFVFWVIGSSTVFFSRYILRNLERCIGIAMVVKNSTGEENLSWKSEEQGRVSQGLSM